MKKLFPLIIITFLAVLWLRYDMAPFPIYSTLMEKTDLVALGEIYGKKYVHEAVVVKRYSEPYTYIDTDKREKTVIQDWVNVRYEDGLDYKMSASDVPIGCKSGIVINAPEHESTRFGKCEIYGNGSQGWVTEESVQAKKSRDPVYREMMDNKEKSTGQTLCLFRLVCTYGKQTERNGITYHNIELDGQSVSYSYNPAHITEPWVAVDGDKDLAILKCIKKYGDKKGLQVCMGPWVHPQSCDLFTVTDLHTDMRDLLLTAK